MAEAAADETLRERRSHEKKLSRASSSDSDEMYSDGSPKGGKAIWASEHVLEDAVKNGAEIIANRMDKTVTLDRTNLPPSTMSFEGHQNVGGESSFGEGIGGCGKAEERQELDLRTLYKLPDFHDFYCPKCKFCITTVIILRDHGDLKSPLPSPLPTPGPPPGQGPALGQSPAQTPQATSGEDPGDRFLCGNCFSFLSPIGTWISSQFPSGGKNPVISTVIDPGSSGIPRDPKLPGDDSFAVPIPPGSAGEGTTDPRQPSGGRRLEIIKSIVYGGLTESITSLGIVTSAASANTPTENIVALALANLITGLIVIVNNLSGLESELKKEPNETEAVQVDQYEEALGDRHHYLLHYTLAILSFLVFGLLPPLVYGFSFRETDDKDLKLAATAIASLLCTALLAIGKAYIQKRDKWQEYVKTVFYYIAIGFGASGLSYLAGKEFDKLVEQLGWFKRNPTTTLSLPDMDLAIPAWGSF